MQVEVIPANRLTPEHVHAWRRLQRAESALASPFFCPEFIQAVGAVRDGVEVAVLAEGGETVGFFPYQRSPREVATAVGGTLCDYQGAVLRPGLAWDGSDLIRGCDLRAWHFESVPASQAPFQRYQWVRWYSTYLDVADGFEAYRSQRRRGGSRKIKQVLRKQRKLAREHGPLRYEPASTDRRVLDTLIRWKVEHYRRIHANNYLAPDWTVALLERLVAERGEAFAGMLGALYAGDRLVAIDLGLRSHDVLHSWFTSYDRELGSYSPGHVLLMMTARAAPKLGIRLIDLGKGPEPYKAHFASGTIALAEGSVDLRPLNRAARRCWLRLRERVRTSDRLKPAARVLLAARPLVARLP